MTVTPRLFPLLIVAALLLALPLAPQAGAQTADRTATASDAFTVSGIPVDVTAQNAVTAREQALDRGQREGLSRLLRRLAPAEEHGRLPSPDNLPVERYVRNFEVTNERLSTTRYIARLTVTYDAAAVRDLLREQGISFAETLSEPLLVLPLYEAPGGLRLWEEGNPWWRAWAQAMDRESLLRLRLPLGDLEDIEAIDADLGELDQDAGIYAPPGERPTLRRIADRYDARGVIVVHAEVESAGEQPGQAPVVTASAQGFGDVEIGDVTATVRGQPDQELEEVLLAAVLRVQDALNEAWKQGNLLRFDRGGTILVDVPLDDLGSWVAINRTLTELPQIGDVQVESFSRDGARLRLAYFGDMPRVQAELAGRGLLLTQEEGNTWLLLRTGATPSRGIPPPFEATTSSAF